MTKKTHIYMYYMYIAYIQIILCMYANSNIYICVCVCAHARVRVRMCAGVRGVRSLEELHEGVVLQVVHTLAAKRNFKETIFDIYVSCVGQIRVGHSQFLIG